ncbi:zinc metalloproteinase nas-13-like [Littorina saxatilis]|uniref:Metalloendopeptidase n=1 Tax=Littorina saxatilis TaxID=31220 RepID=A0AAN9AI80_9CAEN
MNTTTMYVCAVVLTVTVLQCVQAASITKKSIDEIIMAAAPKKSALDTFHMSPEGEIMVTVDLDIRMSITEYMELKGNPEVTRQKRKALKFLDRRWENCKVYYEFMRTDFNSEERAIIQEAIWEWQNYTCLEFIPATSGDRIIFSTGQGGCYSMLGKVGGPQAIGLSRGCVHKGVVIHEIGHAIGWIHEQARPDRDQFIRVNFNRIPTDWHDQFQKFLTSTINYYQVPYDYRSVMHYSGNAVASRSIETLDPMYQTVIGQRRGLSFRDIQLANAMYNCSKMLCPSNSETECSMYGQDAFMFKLDGTCRCVCPGSEGDSAPIMACGPIHTTTTAAATTPVPATTTTLSTTTTSEGEPMECVDLREDCAQLAEDGECAMDMERMYMFCKKSCNFCDKDKMCMDLDPSCPLLALGNFCNREGFVKLMSMRCKKSCEQCTPVDPCEMQRQMGIPIGAASSSPRAHFSIATAVWGFLILAWTLD